MQSDDEAPLTLSKWPFYLGDILLVVTALAIGMLSEWPLTGMQVVSCVLAVALGAAIFVLPYVVEYSMRVREVSDDRESELRLLRGHLQKAEAALMQYHERLQEVESGSGSVDQRCELLASAVDQKLLVESKRVAELSQQLAAIELFKAEQTEALASMKSQIAAFREQAQEPETPSETFVALQAELVALESRFTQSVEPLSAIETFKAEQAEALAAVKEQVGALNAKAQEPDAASESVVALQAELVALEARLTESVEPLSAIETLKTEQADALAEVQAQLETLRESSQAPDALNEIYAALQAELAALESRVSQSVEPLSSIEARLAAMEEIATAPEEERPARVPRQRRMMTDSGLLHRAIKVKQDSASSAVSRIIDSKNRLMEPEQESDDDIELAAKPESESVVIEAVVAAEAPVVEEVPEVVEEPEQVAELDPEAVSEDIESLPENIEVSLGADLIEDDELLEADALDAEQVAELDPEAVSEDIESLPENIEVSLGADLIEDDELLEADALDAEQVAELDPEAVSEDIESLPENIEVSLGADLIEDDELLKADALDAEQVAELESAELEPEETPMVEDEAAIESEVEPTTDASKIFEEVMPATARRAQTKADASIFTVTILIGIGNRPFLRGSGGGLTWESGVPMDFEEIGRWRWVAPVGLEAPLELQVFRNDQDADRKGRYTLEPGQQLEVSPFF
jgi:hypothetical protein